MKYPAWFPYPMCWLKTIILCFSFVFTVFVCRVVGRISLTTILTSAIFIKDPTPRDWALLAWVIFIAVLFPIFLLAHIHQFLWSDPDPKLPSWCPNWVSLGEGIWGWAVAITGVIIGWLMIEEFCPRNTVNRYGELTEVAKNIAAFSWLFTAAYLYHIRLLSARMFNRLKQPRKKRAT